MRIVVLTALLLVLAATEAVAAGCAAPINARQANQQARIANGAEQGDLTARETLRLQARQQHIRRVEARHRADDGVLGPRERCDLNRRLNSTSRGIGVQRHDRQRRY